MNKLILVLSIALILACGKLKADNAWDHMGTTFAIQTIAYGITEHVLGVGTHQDCGKYELQRCSYPSGQAVTYNRTEAVIMSAGLTLLGTLAYSYIKQMSTGNQGQMWREVGYNTIGQATAIGGIYAFQF